MATLNRDLFFLILQFLDEEKLKKTVHMFEQESGFYFNIKYFEDQVHDGNWDVVERYLFGFTKINDNAYSMKMLFEIRKQKYIEALDNSDRAKAVDILMRDLKVFAPYNEGTFKDITQLLTLENIRENEILSTYGDTKSGRTALMIELNKLITANPVFRGKLQFPRFKSSRLRDLINQSLNWQHHLCNNSRSNPDVKTLFIDHSCAQPNAARAPSLNSPLLGTMPQAGGLPPLGPYGHFQFAPALVPASLAGWMSTPPTITHPAFSGGVIRPRAPTNRGNRNPPTNNTYVAYSSVDSSHVSRSTRPVSILNEVNLPANTLPVTCPQNHSQAMYTPDDLPKKVARILNQDSAPMSMDFHPMQQAILLVGTNVGDIVLWNVGSRERLILKKFKVWELGACSMYFQNSLVKDSCVSVNRIIWSPDGSLFGVAYSRHLVQIYSYHGGKDIRQKLEIDAHIGGVNDLAFSIPKERLCVMSCGDDKTIKVWDATTGTQQYTFQGHEAPVFCVCTPQKEDVKFIFSTALDGKVKAWLYDSTRSRLDYDAPGHWCTTMAYSADGSRLFSCGTSKEGDSYLVEWNDSDGAVKRTYRGFDKRSLAVVQFDTTRNRYLAVGDEFLIKFWDMDNTNLLETTDAENGLSANPRIRFNKEGTLLAVSTHDNGIKILANADGLRLLLTFDNASFDASRKVSETAAKPIINPLSSVAIATGSGMKDKAASSMTIAGLNGDRKNLVLVEPRLTDESMDNSKTWKLTEINTPAQCQSLRLMAKGSTSKISRLIYTNSGISILALASNDIHLLWKWPCDEHNPSGKVAASLSPKLYMRPSGNEISDANPEEAVPCFALSKNDSYVISASGGKISLFNLNNFKTVKTFMAPPPAATFLAFHPEDNNILAIGMDDSTIQIYDVRVDELKSKLKGHKKRITGLVFSHVLNVLVSSGADAQICVWRTGAWKKQNSTFMQIPPGCTPSKVSDTCVQFHQDQTHFLAVHETRIAIFETKKLKCVNQWIPHEPYGAISHATFSCDSQSIYVSFVDATVCVFTAANLGLRCRINPSAYLPANVSSTVYPLVVAAHPSEPNQFALGVTDGEVHVLEPLESEGKWGAAAPTAGASGG